MNFEEQATIDIMQIKSNYQVMQFVPFKTFELILSLHLSQIGRIDKLEKQLDYALITGGQYLKIDDIVS